MGTDRIFNPAELPPITIVTFWLIRLLPGNIASPRIGYEVTYLDINSSDARLPRHWA